MKRRILVIDDNVMLCTAATRLFKLDGHDVICVYSVDTALTFLAHVADAVLPQMIITDYEMPHKNGFDFRRAQLSQERLASILTLMWTGRDPRDIQELDELPLEVWVKPVDFTELRQRINNVA